MLNALAAITHGDGKFSIDTIEVDEPRGDEVLVQIKASGICHTDWDSLSWRKDLIIGHEGAGVIVACGPDVRSLWPGSKVVLNWAIPCGNCFQCKLGNEHLCERNSSVTSGNKLSGGHATFTSTRHKGKPIERSFSLGTLSSYTLVREAACISLDVPMPFPSASILGCGVMTGYGSVVNAARVTPGTSVVVIGSGGVGLNVIQAARIAGASTIIAVDVNQQRLDLAMRFGATHTLLSDKNDIPMKGVVKEVKTLTDGRGADYAFECTAIPALGAAPLAMIRNAGMAIQVSGIESEITVDMNLFEWDKIYLNPLYGQSRPTRDFPKMMQLYAEGKLKLDELVTRTYPIEKLTDAFADMLAGRNAKGVIVFG